MPCERCGTFALLRSNGFRRLCEPCWAQYAHRLDAPGRTVGELVRTSFRLLAEHGALLMLLVALNTVPVAVLAWLYDLPMWFRPVWDFVIASFPEAFLVAVVAERSLGGRTALAPALRVARQRYLATAGTNALVSVPVMVGAMLCCLPGFAVAAGLLTAVPLCVLERLPPHRAIATSWRRSGPLFLPLFAITSALFLVSWTPATITGAIAGYHAARQLPLDPVMAAHLRAATVVLSAFLSAPGILLQVVAWAATRPAPATPSPPPTPGV